MRACVCVSRIFKQLIKKINETGDIKIEPRIPRRYSRPVAHLTPHLSPRSRWHTWNPGTPGTLAHLEPLQQAGTPGTLMDH